MDYIYARVSTDGQDAENQTAALLRLYPNGTVITETISGVAISKPKLEALIEGLSNGDRLVISALDRLGRSAWKAIKLIEELHDKGIHIISIREGIDYSTSSGRMIATIMFGVAQMERDLISERTKTALQRLKANGVKLGRKPGSKIKNLKPMGRKPKYTTDHFTKIRSYRERGMTIQEISRLTGVSTSQISHYLNGRSKWAKVLS